MPTSLLTVTPLTVSGISHVFDNIPQPGVILWLDATKIAGITSGTSLSAWTDSSASLSHATQGSAGSQPVYLTNASLNGLPVVSWSTGGKAFLRSATSVNQNFTYAIAVQSRSTTGNHDYIADIGTAAIPLFDSSANKYGTFAGTSLLGSAFTSNAWVTVISQLNGSSTTLSVSGVTFSGNAGTGAGVIAFVGAQDAATAWLNGNIGELIVYNRILSENERVSLETYLRSKWSTL